MRLEELTKAILVMPVAFITLQSMQSIKLRPLWILRFRLMDEFLKFPEFFDLESI